MNLVCSDKNKRCAVLTYLQYASQEPHLEISSDNTQLTQQAPQNSHPSSNWTSRSSDSHLQFGGNGFSHVSPTNRKPWVIIWKQLKSSKNDVLQRVECTVEIYGKHKNIHTLKSGFVMLSGHQHQTFRHLKKDQIKKTRKNWHFNVGGNFHYHAPSFLLFFHGKSIEVAAIVLPFGWCILLLTCLQTACV